MAKPNIKALAIDHGEKIVFGLFGVIVLGVLATTSWSRYQKTPDQLKQQVANARNKISSPENVWPLADQEAHKIVDYSERSRLLFTPLASIADGRYEYSTPLYHPLYRKDEPRREPVFEPIQYLIAVGGRAPISMQVTLADDSGSSNKEETKAKSDEEMPPMSGDEEFQPRPDTSSNAAVAGRGPGAPGASHAMPKGMMPGSPAAAKAPGSSHGSSKTGAPGSSHGSSKTGAAPASGGIFSGMPGGSMMSMGPGSAGADVKALGVRYMAVRGVFPLAKQIDNYRKALHLPHADAANLVEISDFVLERQVATSNLQDPWKDAKWQPVMLTRAEEILDECSGLDPTDPVPTALQDPVITMGLPLRLIFTWGPAATHPKIKGWELNKDEIALENKMIEAADEAATEANLTEPEKQRRRGLAGKQRDIKGLVKSVASNPDMMSMMKGMMGKMGAMTGAPGAPGTRAAAPAAGGAHGATMPMPGMSGMGMGMGGMGMAGMRPGSNSLDRLVVNSQYLLFRYLDFDVEPGLAYRYRVRLQLRNPNFELSPEELGSAEPEIAKGEERETAWSNISNVAVVPSTVDFYLKQVEREPYAEEKMRSNSSKAVAQLKMFDWDMKLGTVIDDLVSIWSIGSYIGDDKKKEHLVLDLANGILDKTKELNKDVNFTTLNVLLDVESDVDVEIAQHPDLKLASADKRGNARIGLVPEALVAMESGEIQTLDPFSERDEEMKWAMQRDMERKGFEIGESKKKANKLDSLADKSDDKADDKKGKKKSKRNPRLSKSSTDPNQSQQQMQQQMMQQMLQSPGAAPQQSTSSKKKR